MRYAAQGNGVATQEKVLAFVIGLHELVPIGGRPAGGQDGRWFERYAPEPALVSSSQKRVVG
jgi:hypothetical protein